MGYRVMYDGSDPYERNGTVSGRLLLLTLVCFGIFLLFTYRYHRDGWDVLTQLVWSGDWAVTRSALERLAMELNSGTPLRDAVQAFCQDVVDGAVICGG